MLRIKLVRVANAINSFRTRHSRALTDNNEECAYIPETADPCFGYVPPHRVEEKNPPDIIKRINMNSLLISPNPSNGEIAVQWDSNTMGAGNKLFRIFDMKGQLWGQISVTSENDTGMLKLNLTSLPQGIYIAQLIGNRQNLINKIIRQ